ncbi:TetR/AcrR family transcriptional regulator [Nocardia brasiliensis]|uniref:TetR/AcrR family transcriptional regulator n=1 Tax=Nocardia brasiliensis TaxID=37326 RepID=UPI003791240D
MPKALSRVELQAQTREAVLAAAERVFLSNGYNATTMAQIANEAGRTHGAIYGHFAGKEALCQEILRRHYQQLLGQVSTALIAVDEITAKLVALEGQWRAVSAQTDWATLTAEYIFAARKDPEQQHSITETVDGLRAGIKAVLLAEAVHAEVTVDDPSLLDQAVISIAGVGIGLVIAQVLGTIDADGSAASFVENVRMWLTRVGVPVQSMTA